MVAKSFGGVVGWQCGHGVSVTFDISISELVLSHGSTGEQWVV